MKNDVQLWPHAATRPLHLPEFALRREHVVIANGTCRRVSTQMIGKFASPRALQSHCGSGPASSPIRLKAVATVTSSHHQPEGAAPKIFSYPQQRRPITPSFG